MLKVGDKVTNDTLYGVIVEKWGGYCVEGDDWTTPATTLQIIAKHWRKVGYRHGAY